MDGFINLLKPPGMTSSDAVVFVRRMLPRGTRVGHGGTLDPDAAGVLPICVGRAARLFDYIIDKQKTYVAELTLGVVTDTQDATGRALVTRPVVGVGEAQIRGVLPGFIGDILQTPPDYSAIKRGGVRLYELARKGAAISVEPRQVRVHGITYLRQSGEGRHMLLVECGKGLYIRTLLHDIGQRLSCGGHMSFLLRSRAGAFAVEDASTPDEIAASGVEALLAPMDAPLHHLPRIDVDEAHLAAIRNGNPVRAEWIRQGSGAPSPALRATAPGNGNLAPVRVYCAGRLCGIGEPFEGGVRFRTMLLPEGVASC